MHKFEDLRFSIGLFFLIVGFLLIVAGFLQSDNAEAMRLNCMVGVGLGIFGALGIFASRTAK